jgi:hypothetical protein
MIRPQVPEYSRPFQLSLLRIGGEPSQLNVGNSYSTFSKLVDWLLEIKGQTRAVHRLALNSKFLVNERSRENSEKSWY